MPNKSNSRESSRSIIARGIASAALLAVSITYAQETQQTQTGWRVDPSLLLRETYSDNIRLAPRGREQDEFVTELVPRLRVNGVAPRLRASIDYAPTLLYFAKDNSGRVRNSLQAQATGEIIDNLFFLEGIGRVYQGGAAALGPGATDSASLNSNILEVRTFGLNPYARGRIGADTTFALRMNNLWTSTSGQELVNAYSRSYLAHVENTVQTIGWSADYDRRETKFENVSLLTMQLYRGRLHWRPDPSLRLFAGAGHEQSNFFPSESSSVIYGGGFDWRPMERASANAAWERRFFGSAYSGNLSYRGQSIAWNASGSRDVSNFALESLRPPAGDTVALLDAALTGRIPDPIERRNAIDQLLRQTGLPSQLTSAQSIYARRMFIISRLETSLVLSGLRNTIAGSVFQTKTRFLADDAFVPIAIELGLRNDFDQRGAAISFTHQFTPLLSGNLFAGRTRTATVSPPTQTSTQDLLRAQASQAISSKTTVFGGVRHVIFKTDAQGFNKFRENAGYVGIEHRF